MKSVLALAVAAGALWIAGSSAPAMAQADPYRWCAELGGGVGGRIVAVGVVDALRHQAERAFRALKGLDSLLSINQMPRGVSVAAMVPSLTMSPLSAPSLWNSPSG